MCTLHSNFSYWLCASSPAFDGSLVISLVFDMYIGQAYLPLCSLGHVCWQLLVIFICRIQVAQYIMLLKSAKHHSWALHIYAACLVATSYLQVVS